MEAGVRSTPWTFADFVPGSELGRVAIAFDDERLSAWRGIYGALPGGTVPAGAMLAAAMQAYLEAFRPRPPGNIHAAQKLAFGKERLKPGDRADAVVTCLAKELRKERHWVTFGVSIVKDGRDVLSGEMLLVWAM